MIRNAAKQADFVIVNSHSHESGNTNEEPPPWLIGFIKKCLDAGAVTYIVHGPHRLRGIEIYKGKPIFYSLADFIFQYETEEPVSQDTDLTPENGSRCNLTIWDQKGRSECRSRGTGPSRSCASSGRRKSRAGARRDGQGWLSQASDHRAHLLPVAARVRRAEAEPGAEAQTAREGELPAQEAGGGQGARPGDPQGGRGGKLLSPARRREAVAHVRRQRRATGEGQDRGVSSGVWTLWVPEGDGVDAHGGLVREPQASAADLA